MLVRRETSSSAVCLGQALPGLIGWLNQRQAPVDDARSKGLRCCSRRASQDEVANASSERYDKGIRVQRRGGASELRLAGLGLGAGGRNDCGAVTGVVGWVGSRDGRGLVGNAAGVGAGKGDGVDSIDSRGDVDGRVVDLALLGEGAHEERKEEDNDLLEGTHLVDGGVCFEWLLKECDRVVW